MSAVRLKLNILRNKLIQRIACRCYGVASTATNLKIMYLLAFGIAVACSRGMLQLQDCRLQTGMQVNSDLTIRYAALVMCF